MGDVPSSITQLKKCITCGQEKPLSEFYRSKRHRSGFESQCKVCKVIAARKRRNDPASAPRERARLWREANPGVKRCTRCKQIKLVSEFYHSSKNPDGLKYRCKACQAETQKGYMAIYNQAYYKAHREEFKAQAACYYKEHGEKIRARVREYCREHAEENRRRSAQWQKDNRERHNEHCRVRRHKKRSNGGSFTVEEWLALCAAYDFRCACCGVLEQTVDHVIPVTKGGSSNIENIQPLCQPCNSAKGTKETDYRTVRGSILSGDGYAIRA